MKRIISILFAVATAITVLAQGEPAFLKTFTPDNRTHDFGDVYEKDGKVSHTYTLRNTGKTPVAISSVNTWCGCMVADYTKRAIRPGETARVNVTFDPDHKDGKFIKQVVLMLNDGKDYVRLWVKANVIACEHPVTEDFPYAYGNGLYMSQQILPFPCKNVGESHSFVLKLANDTDKPMEICFERKPNNRVLQMPDKLTLKAKERTQIRVSYRYVRRHTRDSYINVVPTVNGRQCKPLKVRWNSDRHFELLASKQ